MALLGDGRRVQPTQNKQKDGVCSGGEDIDNQVYSLSLLSFVPALPAVAGDPSGSRRAVQLAIHTLECHININYAA